MNFIRVWHAKTRLGCRCRKK